MKVIAFNAQLFAIKVDLQHPRLTMSGGKGGILAELARKVEVNRQKAIDSPLLRARWRKFNSIGGFYTPGSPKQRLKVTLPGILEDIPRSRLGLTRTISDSGALCSSSTEQQTLEDILHAIRDNKHKKLKNIIKERRININCLNFLGVGPLHEACYHGNLKCVKVLLEHGADVHFADSEGWTPLFAAVCGDHMSCVKLLVANNAAINCSDMYGISPLRIAVTVRNMEMVDYLVKRGADIMAVADDGKSPFQIAVELGDELILAYFLHNPSLHVT